MRRTTLVQLFVSLAGAITLEWLLAIQWWHPYCDATDNGPSSWATGFPLPYAEASLGVSLASTILVPVYMLNLAVLMVPVFAVVRLFWGNRLDAARLLLGATLILSGILVGYGANFDASLIFATRFEPYEPLTAFRPSSIIDFARHRSCDL